MSASYLLFLAATVLAPTDDATLRNYVQQLGDKSYKVRETAALALLKGGAASVSVLQEGTKNTDPEISERCRHLLPMAASLERNEKIAALLKDPSAPPPKGLPSVERFLKIAGDSKDSREQYAEMLGVHHEVLEASEKDPKKAGELLGRFCDDAYNRWQAGIQTGRYSYDNIFQGRADLSMFFFIAGDPKVQRNPTSMSRAQILLNAPRITSGLSGTGADASPVFKALFLAWLENENTTYLVSRGFQIAAQANLKEALPVAKKLLSKKEMVGYNLAQVMLAFVKFADKDSIKDLEPFVDNKTVVTTVNFGNGGQKTVQVGDVALGVIMQLHGQQPTTFGYDARGNAAIMASSYIYYGFGSDKERDETRAKWKEWVTKNLKK